MRRYPASFTLDHTPQFSCHLSRSRTEAWAPDTRTTNSAIQVWITHTHFNFHSITRWKLETHNHIQIELEIQPHPWLPNYPKRRTQVRFRTHLASTPFGLLGSANRTANGWSQPWVQEKEGVPRVSTFFGLAYYWQRVAHCLRTYLHILDTSCLFLI
jgi:hypothetical protein